SLGRAVSEAGSASQDNRLSSSSSSAEYRENSEDDPSVDPFSWVDPDVRKVSSLFIRCSSLLGTSKKICQPGLWSVTVHPCRPEEPSIPSKLGVKLSFTAFERSVLRALNVAPTQLHPNSWAFAPSLGVFFWFFSLRKVVKVGWKSLSSHPRRKLLKPFLESFKVDQGNTGPNILADQSGNPYFPLYWTPQPVVFVTLVRKDLEKWEDEFITELENLPHLSCSELIKGIDSYLSLWIFCPLLKKYKEEDFPIGGRGNECPDYTSVCC
ncbi:hypothetical protein CR513_19970, partial [Mucuna pruriens]